MLPFIPALFALSTSTSVATPVLNQCRPAMARKVEGEISAADVASTTRRGKVQTIRGSMTALVGMGDPGPGRAKANHLIRERYSFVCSVRARKVRSLKLTPID
jgi:hypothetical protein